MSQTVTVARRGKGKRKMPGVQIPNVIREHGLEMQFLRGNVVVDHQAIDDQSGPASRRVSRPRRISKHHALHAGRFLTDAQFEAAEWYALTSEIATGAKFSSGEKVGGSRSSLAMEPSQVMTDATSALRRAHEALGYRSKMVVALLVVENLGCAQIATQLGGSQRTSLGWVQAALERLAEHRGLIAPPRKKP